MTIRKVGERWCVFSESGEKLGCHASRGEAVNQLQAIEASKARRGQDSIVLKNQPIAREGVLPYRAADGSIIYKLKRWKDLKRNIGRRVPIIDEHPVINNGAGGLFNGKKQIHGWATIHQYKNYKMLAADMEFNDDFPVKNGFSMGYPYIPLPGKGDHDGEKYDEVQASLLVDHVALTNFNREPTALLSAWDSHQVDNDIDIPGVYNPLMEVIGLDTLSNEQVMPGNAGVTGAVNKYCIGYDSFKMLSLDSIRSRDEIKEKILGRNTGISGDKLEELVETAFRNQFRTEQLLHLFKNSDANMAPDNDASQKLVESENPLDEHEKKKKKKTDVAGTGGDALERLDRLEAMITKLVEKDTTPPVPPAPAPTMAIDNIEETIAKIVTTAIKTSRDADQRQHETRMNTGYLQSIGFTSKDLDGKSDEEIRGMVTAAKLVGARRSIMSEPVRKAGKDSFGIVYGPGPRVSFDAQNYLEIDPDNHNRMRLPKGVGE